MAHSSSLEGLLSGDPQAMRLQPRVQIVLPRQDMLDLDSVRLIDLFHPFVKDSFFHLSYEIRPKSVQAAPTTRRSRNPLIDCLSSLHSQTAEEGICVRQRLALRPFSNLTPLLDYHQWSTGAWPLPFTFDMYEIERDGQLQQICIKCALCACLHRWHCSETDLHRRQGHPADHPRLRQLCLHHASHSMLLGILLSFLCHGYCTLSAWPPSWPLVAPDGT